MAEPTLVASSQLQLPAILATKASRPKKVIIVRRIIRAAEDTTGITSSVPTLPAIKRASWTDRPSDDTVSVESKSLSSQHNLDRAQTAPPPLLPVEGFAQGSVGAAGGHGVPAESETIRKSDPIADANPDEFGALILANTLTKHAQSSGCLEECSLEQTSSKDGQDGATESLEKLVFGADAIADFPADLAAAIEASEDGGAAIRDAYERRRQHRRELAMQASLLRQQQCEEEEVFLASQRIQAGAETKAFEKWQQAQEEWERVKKTVMAQTGKPEAELVMERGREYRAVKEAKEHLEAAKPTEEKFSGATMWEMSLRDHWTLSVPVGNIFGRIFPPACSAKPREIERIGRPELVHTGPQNGTGTTSSSGKGTTTWGGTTGTETGTRHRHGTGSRPRGWLDSDAVKERQQKLRKEMQRLQPHEPEMDGLQVVGYSIEAGLAAAAAAPITLEEVEKELATCNNHAYTQLLEERARAAAAAAQSAATVTPAEILKPGPAFELAAERMTLCAAAGAVATELLEVQNTGSTVLFYRWEREKNTSAVEFATGAVSRGVSRGVLGRFFQMDTEGALRPGERKGFGFSFKSVEPGTWLETWKLVTEPKVTSPSELIIKGIAFEPEKPSREASRSEVEGDLATRIRGRAVAEAVDAIVDAVETPSSGRQETQEDEEEVAGELDFVRANFESGEILYYRPEEYTRAVSIAEAVSAIEERASKRGGGESTEDKSTPKDSWDGSVESLTERLNLLGSAGGVEGLKQRLQESTKKLRVPPSRRALVRRAMYVVLTSAADAIVDGVEAARAAAESDERAATAAAATESENPEEVSAELEPDVELDEEVLRAQAEAREKATREEAIRRATSGAAEALDALEECLKAAESEFCGQLDGKLRELLQSRDCESVERNVEDIDWKVFALERQKQELLTV